MDFETIILEKEEKAFETFLKQKIREFNNEHSLFHHEARKPGAVKALNIIVKNESGETSGRAGSQDLLGLAGY